MGKLKRSVAFSVAAITAGCSFAGAELEPGIETTNTIGTDSKSYDEYANDDNTTEEGANNAINPTVKADIQAALDVIGQSEGHAATDEISVSDETGDSESLGDGDTSENGASNNIDDIVATENFVADESCRVLEEMGYTLQYIDDVENATQLAAGGFGLSANHVEQFHQRAVAVAGFAGDVSTSGCIAIPAASVTEISDQYFEHMQGVSWRDGCLSGPDQLRIVDVPYYDFDGYSRMGSLVVHHEVAHEVGEIFLELNQLEFPIHSISPLEDIVEPDSHLITHNMNEAGQLDDVSMSINNTSAFNCRSIAGTSGTISNHGKGLSVDINPLQNPYVSASGMIMPSEGADFMDRSVTADGVIGDDERGRQIVESFTSRGWQWGGYWTNPIDWQHFEKPLD
jgi:hypothetical protein